MKQRECPEGIWHLDTAASFWNLQLKAMDSIATGLFIFILLNDVIDGENVRCVVLFPDRSHLTLEFTSDTLINSVRPFVLARALQ